MNRAGFLQAKEIQSKTMSRISGGQDVIAIAPEGAGKTTTIVLASLLRVKYGFEEAPRVLILVPNKERMSEMMALFDLLNKNQTIRIKTLDNEGGIETQVEEITDGVDIVVALPNRARAVYLKLGLNVNKLELFVVDDASEIVKQGLQLPVTELAQSAQKCQHLVFSDVMHERIEKMINPFMRQPFYIEVDELSDAQVETHTHLVYQVPNFRTKLNLLANLLEDKEVFEKVVVLVDTRLTAQKVSKDIFHGRAEDVYVLKPLFFDDKGFENIEDFKENENARVLIVAREVLPSVDFSGVPFVFNFDLGEHQALLSNLVKQEGQEELVFISFITDLELPQLRKLEQAIGSRLEFSELPENLLVEQTKKADKKQKLTEGGDEDEAFRNGAFQEKLAKNAKTTNYGAGKKAVMDKKRKHG